MRSVNGAIAAVLLAAGCASTPTPPESSTGTPHVSVSPIRTCTPPAGGRCAGPSSIAGASIELSRDGQTLTYTSNCGGTLTAVRESSDVRLTYVASAVGAGAMACARVPVSVHLASPLGTLPVLDSVSGETLQITRN